MKRTVITTLLIINVITLNIVLSALISVHAQTTYTVVPNTLPTSSYSPPLEITINADGSINPSSVAIERKNNIYSMTDNITGRITVKKSNIVFDGDGHTLTYAERGPGNIYALGISASNNTVKNVTVIGGWYGISLYKATNTLIVNNTILETVPFMPPFNPSGAVNVEFGSLNVIMNNNLANNYVGFRFFETNSNLIVGNNIENSSALALGFSSGSNNTVYHNNFVNNAKQVGVSVFDSPSSGNVWDNGYPLGGNYWSDYKKKYPNASETDSSGIGDTAYVIDSQNQDRFPLLEPFTSTMHLLQTTPPKISLLSPLNQTYSESNISLVFAVDKAVNWTGYSLDGKQNATIMGNATLTGLSGTQHNVTVYANDTFGNMGASENVTFTIPQPFPIVPVAIVCLIIVVFASGGLLFYRKHRGDARHA